MSIYGDASGLPPRVLGMEVEKASDTGKGATIALMCRSQGDSIAGRCITGATFVGPIQLNLGYGNTISQRWMVSMGAESSIMCEHLLSSARNMTESHTQEVPWNQRADWISLTLPSSADLIGSTLIAW